MKDETLKLLVVDDEPGMLSGASRALRDFVVPLDDTQGKVGFTISTAADGETASRLIDEEEPDIVLLDYKLPGMSGMDVLRELAERRPDILPIMITAYATLETAVTATKRGAFDFLAKPFTPAELKNVVEKAARHIILSRRARQLAEERRRVRFEFISVLAHELKSPLNAVEGYLQAMRDKVSGDDLAAYERPIDRSLMRVEGMRKLIYDLLDLTRIESGEKLRNVTSVDVTDVARGAMEAVVSEASARGISLDLHAAGPVTMDADRGEIEIILNNLVSNAVKYNRDDGWVRVEVRGEEGQVFIQVADGGIGMTPEEAGKLFQDFVRIKNAKTRGIQGSGLGLSIVRKLAALYGGEAKVKSEPGVGSTFTVVLSRAS
ncbi:MAG: sensor histidine kinase [Myxococcota bacterium]